MGMFDTIIALRFVFDLPIACPNTARGWGNRGRSTQRIRRYLLDE